MRVLLATLFAVVFLCPLSASAECERIEDVAAQARQDIENDRIAREAVMKEIMRAKLMDEQPITGVSDSDIDRALEHIHADPRGNVDVYTESMTKVLTQALADVLGESVPKATGMITFNNGTYGTAESVMVLLFKDGCYFAGRPFLRQIWDQAASGGRGA